MLGTNKFSYFLTGDSRKLFDSFFRKLLEGNNAVYPKPKSFKLTKNQLFQDKDTVFDFVYDKRNNGTWIPWVELEKEVPLLPTAKVSLVWSGSLLRRSTVNRFQFHLSNSELYHSSKFKIAVTQ